MTSDLAIICANDISREGLQRILSSDGFNIVLASDNADRLVKAGLDNKISILVDLADPDAQLQAVETVAAAYPAARIAVLVDEFDMQQLIHCFDAGTDGYIVKSMNCRPLITALKLVALGQKFLPSELADVLGSHSFDRYLPAANLEAEMGEAKLSARERDVLCCLMAGHSNKLIARELVVCEATVKVHVKAILRKLDVTNRTQAAMWASTRGFPAHLAQANSLESHPAHA